MDRQQRRHIQKRILRPRDIHLGHRHKRGRKPGCPDPDGPLRHRRHNVQILNSKLRRSNTPCRHLKRRLNLFHQQQPSARRQNCILPILSGSDPLYRGTGIKQRIQDTQHRFNRHQRLPAHAGPEIYRRRMAGRRHSIQFPGDHRRKLRIHDSRHLEHYRLEHSKKRIRHLPCIHCPHRLFWKNTDKRQQRKHKRNIQLQHNRSRKPHLHRRTNLRRNRRIIPKNRHIKPMGIRPQHDIQPVHQPHVPLRNRAQQQHNKRRQLDNHISRQHNPPPPELKLADKRNRRNMVPKQHPKLHQRHMGWKRSMEHHRRWHLTRRRQYDILLCIQHNRRKPGLIPCKIHNKHTGIHKRRTRHIHHPRRRQRPSLPRKQHIQPERNTTQQGKLTAPVREMERDHKLRIRRIQLNRTISLQPHNNPAGPMDKPHNANRHKLALGKPHHKDIRKRHI